MWFVHILISILFVLIPLAIFVIIAEYAVKDRSSVAKHILYCIGGTLAGIGITFLSVVFAVKCHIMDDMEPKKDYPATTEDRTRRIKW